MEDILEFDEYIKFESNAEVGKIEFWCEKYPEKIYEIMTDVIKLGGLNCENIKIAIEYGWDINRKHYYPTDCSDAVTPLESCLEFRQLDGVRSLLKNGANVSSECYYIVAMGHYYGAHEKIDEIIECINLLEKYGCVFKYDDKLTELFDEIVFVFWKENCEFLYNFFKKR